MCLSGQMSAMETEITSLENTQKNYSHKLFFL